MYVLLKDVLNTKLSHCQTPKRWFLTIAKTSSITNDYEVFCMILGFIMEVHLSHFPWAIKMMIDDCVVYYFQFISQVKILIQNEDGQRNESFLPSQNIWNPIKFNESCYILCWWDLLMVITPAPQSKLSPAEIGTLIHWQKNDHLQSCPNLRWRQFF